jgi:hypothetical protein
LATTFGEFGETEASLLASGFFAWFHFESAGDASDADQRAFRPSGEAFHDLVLLTTRATAEGMLQGLTLSLRRSFIADTRQAPFARDLAKSFLGAVASADLKPIAPLMDEIFFRDSTGPVLMRGPRPQLPAKPSEGYLTFAGDQSAWATKFGQLALTMTNLADSTLFVMEARRAPGRGGWLSQTLQSLKGR